MKKPKKLLIVGALAAGALLAAACQHGSAEPTKHHSATPQTSCHAITAKAHIHGTSQYLLTLKGVEKPVQVPKPAYKAAAIGSRYCADK